MTNEQLARRIRAGENEAENMKTLWIQCKAFVAKMARKYSGYAEMDDLMQEGFLGLCDAVEHATRKRGRVSSYAGFWIKQLCSAVLSVPDPCGCRPISIQ